MTGGANALDQRALRHELDLHFASEHLLLSFGIEPDVARNDPAHQIRRHEFPDADARQRRVVGDHREVALALADELVDDPLGRANTHEAAHHQARAILNLLDRAFEGCRPHARLLATSFRIARPRARKPS
jgi:hypothetical protein